MDGNQRGALPGRSQIVRNDSTPAVVSELTWETGSSEEPRNEMELKLVSVSGCLADLGEAGFHPGRSGSISVETDGESTFALLGASGPVFLDGVRVGVAQPHRPFDLLLSAGEHLIEIRP